MASRGTKQIAVGAIISYMAIGVNVLIGLIYTPWMIKTIGSSNYGLYTLALSVINVFAVDFGLSSATTRFVTKKVVEKDSHGVQNVLGIIAKLYLIIAAVIFVSLIIIYPFLGIIYRGLTPVEFQAFQVVYIIVATYSVVSFPFISLNGVFSAYEEFVAMKLCDLFQKIGSVLLIVLVLVVGGGLYELVTVNALSGLVTIIVKLFVLRKKHQISINWKYKDVSLLKEIFKFSIWTTVVSICTRLIFNLVPSILGMVSDSIAIAQYGVASTIDGYFYTFASALGNLFLARVTKLLYGSEKNESALTELSVRIGKIQLIIISFIYIGFVSIGKEFIILWMGQDYVMAYYCVVLLAFPDIIEYAQQIPRDAVIASNKIKSQAKAFVITAAIAVPITFVGAMIGDSLGASIGICIACVLRTVTMCLVYKKELDFELKSFFLKTYPRIVPVFVICSLFACVMNTLFVADSFIKLLTKGILVFIAYMTVCFVFFLTRQEKLLIKKYLLKRK